MIVVPTESEPITAARPWRFARSATAADLPPMGGAAALSGTVRVARVAAARIVEVYDQATMTLANSTISDATTGAWSVGGLTASRPLRTIVRGAVGERDVTVSGLYAT